MFVFLPLGLVLLLIPLLVLLQLALQVFDGRFHLSQLHYILIDLLIFPFSGFMIVLDILNEVFEVLILSSELL